MEERTRCSRAKRFRTRSTLDEIQSYDIYKIDSHEQQSHNLPSFGDSSLSSSLSGFLPQAMPFDHLQQSNSGPRSVFYNSLSAGCNLAAVFEERNIDKLETNLMHYGRENVSNENRLLGEESEDDLTHFFDNAKSPKEMKLTLTKDDNTEMEIGSLRISMSSEEKQDAGRPGSEDPVSFIYDPSPVEGGESVDERPKLKVDIHINDLIKEAILEESSEEYSSDQEENYSQDEHDFDDSLTNSLESWVDLSKSTNSLNPSRTSSPPINPAMAVSPDRVTPGPPLPFGNGEEYLRLLREAQKESNQSSARVSHESSRKDTPKGSPKSPPNSPNTELLIRGTGTGSGNETSNMKGFYINYFNKEGDFIRVEKNTETDWIWDWSSRPDQVPPNEWKFHHPTNEKKKVHGASIRNAMVGNSKLFSRDVLYTLLITNVLSLLLGTGIGIWLSKKSSGTLTINAMPLN